jgi:hypothetical protein
MTTEDPPWNLPANIGLPAFTSIGDGWDTEEDDEGGKNPIQGTLFTFTDGNYYQSGSSTPMPKGIRLIAVGYTKGWIFWKGKRPIWSKSKLLESGKHLPERNTLGDTDQSLWELNPDGKPKDPWRLTKYIYFIDPLTAEYWTFSSSSQGGAVAVGEVKDAIARVRTVHPNAVPEVEPVSAPWKTKYGMKTRPKFVIKGWKGGNDGTALAADAPAQLNKLDEEEEEDIPPVPPPSRPRLTPKPAAKAQIIDHDSEDEDDIVQRPEPRRQPQPEKVEKSPPRGSSRRP